MDSGDMKRLFALGLSVITILLLTRKAKGQEPPPVVIRELIAIKWR